MRVTPEIDVTHLTAGHTLPALVLPSLDGSDRLTTAFLGQKLILHIFASW